MRDLAGIAEINGPRRVELQAERAERILDAHPILPAHLARVEHGQRVAARAAVNGTPFNDASEQHLAGFAIGVDALPPTEKFSGVQDSPFLTFWKDLNAFCVADGQPEVRYGEAREKFLEFQSNQNMTEVYASDGLYRARRVAPVQGKPAWHGETLSADKWIAACNSADLPIVYETPKAAIAGAQVTFS